MQSWILQSELPPLEQLPEESVEHFLEQNFSSCRQKYHLRPPLWKGAPSCHHHLGIFIDISSLPSCSTHLENIVQGKMDPRVQCFPQNNCVGDVTIFWVNLGNISDLGQPWASESQSNSASKYSYVKFSFRILTKHNIHNLGSSSVSASKLWQKSVRPSQAWHLNFSQSQVFDDFLKAYHPGWPPDHLDHRD